MKDFGLNWRVAELLSQIGFRGSVRNIQLGMFYNSGQIKLNYIKPGSMEMIVVGFWRQSGREAWQQPDGNGDLSLPKCLTLLCFATLCNVIFSVGLAFMWHF